MNHDTTPFDAPFSEPVRPTGPSATKPISGAFVANTYTPSEGEFEAQDVGFQDGVPYYVYVPSEYEDDSATPLVVMLHGCLQDPFSFALSTEMNDVAERENFVVAYPGQSTTRSLVRCWNWFSDTDTTRGQGEAASIAGVTREVMSDYAIDSNRVYVAGLSAGGAMAAALAVAYPDLYAAVGIHSGLEYDAADSREQAADAMENGGPDPQSKGTQAYRDMEERARVVPTIVFHGNRDRIVAPLNGTQATEQATHMNDLAADGTDDDSIDYRADRVVNGVAYRSPFGRRYTRSEYHDETGTPVVVEYMVEGMDHAWSGGAYGGSFSDPSGPDASQLMWDFFDAQAMAGEPTADAKIVLTGAGTSVSFYGGDSTAPGSSISSYEWEFDDEATATGERVSHSFERADEYSVKLTITDETGATATDRVRIVVADD